MISYIVTFETMHGERDIHVDAPAYYSDEQIMAKARNDGNICGPAYISGR